MLEDYTSQPATTLGYEILRDHVLPNILGKHEDDILYWAGKDIARKFPVFSIDEIPDFFKEAGWGLLKTAEKKMPKDEALFVISGIPAPVLERRSFQLEAGFIAGQFQKLNGFLTECYGEKSVKDETVQFHVKWDVKTKM